MVEESVDAAMGGDDGKLASPHCNGFGDAIEKALILMKRELVESDMAAFAREGVWIGGK